MPSDLDFYFEPLLQYKNGSYSNFERYHETQIVAIETRTVAFGSSEIWIFNLYDVEWNLLFTFKEELSAIWSQIFTRLELNLQSRKDQFT